ncbi:hypothetical protein ACHAQA_000467 [Verticillium albo-atrum]
MKTFTASAIVLALAAMAEASPLIARANVCNTAPAGSAAASPRSQPAAATADICRQRCDADSGCLSFVFGLPASGTTPTCMLFAVQAAQVPAQSNTNLMVFDKACTGVPTAAPTRNNAGNNQNNGNGNGNTAGNGQNAGSGNTAGNGQNAGQQQGGNAQQPKKRANVCGAAPTGPSTNSQTPLQTLQNISTQEACLERCRATAGCQSIEFGKPAANQPNACRLFNVPASSLPRPSNGQSFAAFDVGC